MSSLAGYLRDYAVRILFFPMPNRLVHSSFGYWPLLPPRMLLVILYGGRLGVNYFCPMKPYCSACTVNLRDCSAAKAHTRSANNPSMCRTVLPDGKEQSACVKRPKSMYWYWFRNGYVGTGWASLKVFYPLWILCGLVVGYFVYYYLYAGEWEYYFSVAWARPRNPIQLTTLCTGFYLFGLQVNIPQINCCAFNSRLSLQCYGYLLRQLD
jgi:hypothetical protein